VSKKIKPEKFPLRIHPYPDSLKTQKKTLAASLEAYTVEYLKRLCQSLIGNVPTVKKADLIFVIAEGLTFVNKDAFTLWFDSLPPLTQGVLYRLTFTDFLPVSVLEKEYNKTFLVKEERYRWAATIRVDEKLLLGFLSFYRSCDQYILGLPLFLREILAPWFEPPPEEDIANCVSENADPGWDNSQLVADSYPLLCDAFNRMFGDISEHERNKTIKGFNKKQTAELLESSDFLRFDMARGYCPESIELILRFMLCIKKFKPVHPKDAHDDIRDMVTAFFSEASKNAWRYTDRNYLEYNVCIDHLSKPSGYYPGDDERLPESRKIFYEILMDIAKDGRRFDAGKLAEHLRITVKNFSFCGDEFVERGLKLKADSLNLDGITYTYIYEGYRDISPTGILRHHLLVKPLFKAYCYIFAALGLLEITQETPALALTKNNKQYPVSPYDSLKTIRITKFGLWCLGLSSEKPLKPVGDYQAIADKELLLVTVQGKSLERKVYLDRIGVKLGEDRWRISPASFIAGCETPGQIDDRIARFKTLIDPAPAPHWLELFDKVVSRVGLFSLRRNDMLVYDLPQDRKITEELLRDPELKNVALRAEGGILIVPAKNYKKFVAFLNEHGIAGF